jgi:hypothetical protein
MSVDKGSPMSDVLSVVISAGNCPGMMPRLPGAYVGAAEYIEWAKGQGHTILAYSDEKGTPVSAVAIQADLDPYIRQQQLSQLFVYYAGHGHATGFDEDYWLFDVRSGLVGNAVDVVKTVAALHQSGISRVVIIADACRVPSARSGWKANLMATPLVPCGDFDKVDVEVDRIWGAKPGLPALEVQFVEPAAKSHGVFTHTLLCALRGEVAQVQERSIDGTRMIVRCGDRLKAYLQETVPALAAALPNGYSQMPDCRGTSKRALANLGAVPLHEIIIATEFEDGSPVDQSRITLSWHKERGEWEEVATKPGPRAVFQAPSGLIYRSAATAPPPLVPCPPLPLMELTRPIAGRYVAPLPPQQQQQQQQQQYQPQQEQQRRQKELDRQQQQMFQAIVPSEALDRGATIPQSSAPFALTRVLAPTGEALSRADGPGVFRVVTYDVLTNQAASRWQEFRSPKEPPVPVPIEEPSSDRLSAIVAEASNHARGRFETNTGMTLLGYPPEITPRVAAAPGLVDGVFVEGGRWNIRGTSSGGVVLALDGERFAAVALFEDLVGAVRVAAMGENRLELADLTYAPAEDGRFAGSWNSLTEGRTPVAANARDELDALQLVAAASARNGFLEATIDDSVGLARHIRQYKHVNPILGVFAAYAYDRAGRREAVIDMIRWYIREEQTTPYDLLLLAGMDFHDFLEFNRSHHAGWSRTVADAPHRGVAPPWPLLSQGWSRLPAKMLERFPVLAEARDSLAPALWTTIVGGPGQRLFDAVNSGALQWI